MSWINIGLLAFTLILCFIIVVLYFYSLTSLGNSRAGIIDDQVADSAYSWGTWATLAGTIAIALILSLIILFWYEVSGEIVIKILLVVTFLMLILSGGFALASYYDIISINNPDQDIGTASSYMYWGAILSFISAIFIIVVFIIDLIYTDDIVVKDEEKDNNIILLPNKQLSIETPYSDNIADNIIYIDGIAYEKVYENIEIDNIKKDTVKDTVKDYEKIDITIDSVKDSVKKDSIKDITNDNVKKNIINRDNEKIILINNESKYVAPKYVESELVPEYVAPKYIQYGNTNNMYQLIDTNKCIYKKV